MRRAVSEPLDATTHPRIPQQPGRRQSPYCRDREDELAASDAARRAHQDGVARGELPPEPVWASQAIGLITDVPPAADLAAALAAQAAEALDRARGSQRLTGG
jgi:NAD(P)H-dependent flavin oxidoreductase YrpB (nitropropane dioxygenase family)